MLFLNPLLLAGLAAVVIPPVVHFFARRRYDEVDWAAMQFLEPGTTARRKLLLEQWLLMAVRMAVLGLLAAALAGPVVRGSWLAGWKNNTPRSTVVLIDASASTGFRQNGRTTADDAKDWADRFLAGCRPTDRAAVFAVTGELVPLAGALTEPAQARAALELLPTPRGAADWPGAIDAATKLLADAPGEPEIVVIADGQRFGWADADTLARWELFARSARNEGRTIPRMWVANVAADRPANPPNALVQPITANRAAATAAAEVRFRAGVRRIGPASTLPRVRLEIDGRPAGEVAAPPAAAAAVDVPLTFARRFPAGSHLVTLRIDPDALPGDDRQDFALDVLPAVPVLLVDGSARASGGDFLHQALAPTRDPSPAFAVRTVPLAQFTPTTLSQPVPRVLVLANAAKLSAEQSAAVERFLADGGGVLVALGDRAEAEEWNRTAFRAGRGWLPVRLGGVVAFDGDPTTAPKPRTPAFDHPAVSLFRESHPGGLHTAYFPRYWKLEPDPATQKAGVIARLTNDDPLLVEKAVGNGRVIVAAVPLDNSGGTNLITLPDYLPLVHELAYHLAGVGGAAVNLAPGDPIVFRPTDDESPGPVTVVPPDGVAKVVPASTWPLVYPATRDPGPYKLTTTAGRVRYFAVRPDPRESDLAPTDAAGMQKVAALLGSVEAVTSVDDLAARRGTGPVSRDLTDLALAAVIVLLVAEVWYTRRLMASR